MNAFAGRVARAWAALPPNVQGAIWIALSAFVLSFQALLTKHLGTRLGTFQVSFVRSAFQFISILPFVYGTKSFFLTGHLGTHITRSAVGAGALLANAYSVIHLPLAIAMSLNFSRQLFLILLAALFLHEVMQRGRLIAIVVGFLGVVLIMRPGSELFDPASIVAVLGAFFAADVAILVKNLSGTERNATILFYYGFITTLVVAPVGLYLWINPTLDEWLLLAMVGGLASVSQYCILKGLRVGEATAVMPFDYLRLVFAGLLGFLIYAETPDLLSLSGMAVLIACSFYIARNELKASKKPSL